jgi:hypothetical protein
MSERNFGTVVFQFFGDHFEPRQFWGVCIVTCWVDYMGPLLQREGRAKIHAGANGLVDVYATA